MMESGALAHAFRRFESAATRLEESHSSLHDEVLRLEGELLQSNRRLEAVLEAADGGIAVVDDDGRLVRTNRSFETLGLGRDDLCGILAGDPRNGHRTSFRHRERDLEACLTPTDDRWRVLTVRDVGHIRREEQEGGRRKRLEALGRMAAELAHEVRNPLGSIRLFAEMLRTDLAQDVEKRSMLEHILASTAGLETTVSNLLAFAGPGDAPTHPCDLTELTADVCGLLAPACAQRGVRIEGPAEDRPCRIVGQPEGLRQVVLNLLGNALEATNGRGAIRVAVERLEDRAILEVDDDGCGIEPDDLGRVFDPFFSRSRNGTGLGLSIVHRIVEGHGGRIGLESRPGVGTRARVELPAGGSA